MPRNTLYICYFGLRQPLVQTQVLPYLRELAAGGWSVSLLTFEPGWPDEFPEAEQAERRAALARDGIAWHAHPYTRSHGLLAKVKDIVTGLITARRIARKARVNVVHGRAHVGTAVASLVAASVRPRPGILFDIRGFNPEESVDAGRWKPGGLKFRLLKAAERMLLRRSAGFVVLTDAGRAILFPDARPDPVGPEAWALPDGRPVQIIPCCVDLSRFDAAATTSRDEAKKADGLEGRRVITYVGTLGGWYLNDEMVRIWAAAKRMDPTSFALIFTQSPPDEIRAPLTAAGLVEDADFRIRKVAPDELGQRLRCADVALSVIMPSFSKIASSPTKLAEYLAAGCTVISTSGIGDGDRQLLDRQLGVILHSFDDAAIEHALRAAFDLADRPDTADRCRRAARELFDLKTVGGPRYRCLYDRLVPPEPR